MSNNVIPEPLSVTSENLSQKNYSGKVFQKRFISYTNKWVIEYCRNGEHIHGFAEFNSDELANKFISVNWFEYNPENEIEL